MRHDLGIDNYISYGTICVNGVYGVLRSFIIGFDSLLFTTYNVRLRWD